MFKCINTITLYLEKRVTSNVLISKKKKKRLTFRSKIFHVDDQNYREYFWTYSNILNINAQKNYFIYLFVCLLAWFGVLCRLLLRLTGWKQQMGSLDAKEMWKWWNYMTGVLFSPFCEFIFSVYYSLKYELILMIVSYCNSHCILICI